MVTPGTNHPDKKNITPNEIALRTVIAFTRSVPVVLPGIMFLSGG